MLIGIFYSQVVESSSLVSVLIQEAISHPYISFFHFLINGFLLLVSVLFRRPLTFIILVGGIGGQEGIKMASAKNNQLISSEQPHFSPRSTVKTNGKSYKSQEEWHLLL